MTTGLVVLNLYHVGQLLTICHGRDFIEADVSRCITAPSQRR